MYLSRCLFKPTWGAPSAPNPVFLCTSLGACSLSPLRPDGQFLCKLETLAGLGGRQGLALISTVREPESGVDLFQAMFTSISIFVTILSTVLIQSVC